MKPKIMKMPTWKSAIAACFITLAALNVPGQTGAAVSATDPEPRPDAENGLVYVIPIQDMIEPALLYILRRGLEDAEANGARAVVFEMDTPGGRVDVTEEIVQTIIAVDVPTYTFVQHNAISAGAIIALSTDYIYMTPGSKIGDAMPIMAAPGGGMQELGEAEREKIESYVDTLVRSIAQQKGRDEEMASAMVRRDIEYKIGDEIICAEGRILTLTNLEAERRYVIDGVERPLLSEGTVESLDDMLQTVGLGDAEIRRLEVSELEKLARFISMIAPILMTIGMLALWIELQTPGIGWGAMVGVVCLGLFFFGHHIAGLAGNEELLVFVAGIILLLIELFLLPGFGFIGLIGVLMILWSLLTSMAPSLPGNEWVPAMDDLKTPARNLALSLIMTGAGMLLLGKFLPKSRSMSWLVLQESTSGDAGYTATSSLADLVGTVGKTVTPLRPGGSARFGDRRVDVMTRGEFLDQGAPVQAIEAHGSHLVVTQAPPGDPTV